MSFVKGNSADFLSPLAVRVHPMDTIRKVTTICERESHCTLAVHALTQTRSFLFLKDRRTVNNSSGFEDLMKRYINQQGGCEAIFKDFQ
jgi:hypothetical protein